MRRMPNLLDDFRRKSDRVYLIFSLVIGALLGATSVDVQPVLENIDAEYNILYNYTFLHGYPGHDVAATYGPLGFIVHTLRLGILPFLSIGISCLLGLVTGWLLYALTKHLKSTFRYPFVFLATLLICMQPFEWKLYAIFLLAALNAYLYRSARLLMLLAIAAGLSLYVKISLGIAVSGLTVLLAIILRPPRKAIGWGLLSYAATVIVAGPVLYRSAGLAVDYLKNGVTITVDYAASMSSQPTNWKQIICYLLAGLVVVLVSSYIMVPKTYWPFAVLLLGAVFFAWKEAVIRQDPYGHTEALPYFLTFVVLVAILLRLQGSHIERKYLIWPLPVSLVGVCLLFWAIHLAGYTNQRLLAQVGEPLTFWRVEDCQLDPCSGSPPLTLSSSLLREIGSQTIDVYPWQPLYAVQNKLHWDPRPSPASYATYSTSLDDQNAAFWTSRYAPKFILWDNDQGVLSIDGRNLFFDEPAALSAMLANYKLVNQSGSLLLLERGRPPAQPRPQRITKPQPLAWNQWFNVPHGSGDKVYISYDKDLRQTIGAVIFRPEPLFIELQKQSGATASYRLVPGDMDDGLLLGQTPFTSSQLTAALSGRQPSDPVVRARITGDATGQLSVRYSE